MERLVVKRVGKRSFRKSRRRCKDNIKICDNQVYSVRCYSEAGAVEVSCEQVSEIGFHKMRGVPVCK